MKTYVIVTGDFSQGGGMDRANYELAWHLADRAGARVHLVGYSVAEPLASHANTIWHRVAKPLNSYLLAAPMLARRGRQVASSLSREGARVIVNGGNCEWDDVNWVHSVQAAWPTRDRHAPLIFRLRNRLAKVRARRSERRALSRAKTVVTNSQAAKKQLVRCLHLPPERIKVVYLAADASRFRPHADNEKAEARRKLNMSPDGRHVAIFIGAMGHDRNKGFDVLFEAWKNLCADPTWDVNLLAAGPGAEVTLWCDRAKDAGLTDRIRVLGFTGEIPTLMAAADVLISPTRYDAYGLAVHEALCCGVPAIVSSCAGVAERIPASMGGLLLSDPNDRADLTARIRAWRADVPRYRAAAASASAELRQYTWANMSEKFIAAIEARD
jgi:glycosyltransferase involved in cell wall biosynthesis